MFQVELYYSEVVDVAEQVKWLKYLNFIKYLLNHRDLEEWCYHSDETNYDEKEKCMIEEDKQIEIRKIERSNTNIQKDHQNTDIGKEIILQMYVKVVLELIYLNYQILMINIMKFIWKLVNIKPA